VSAERNREALQSGFSDLDPVAEGDELTPEFRVIIAGNRRRGIRLERMYWRLLGEIAERRGVKRSRLVASVLEEADSSSDNAASVLRCFAIDAIDAERSVLVGRTGSNYVIGLLQQAPIPAFAINRQKKLHQVNQEFIQLLRAISGNANQRVHADVVQLTLETPIEELFLQLSDAKSAHTNYNIQLDAKHRRGRTKLVAVPPSPAQVLVGYIVS
jgi:predicted DNA-binding ribbon-helix-helix protein